MTTLKFVVPALLLLCIAAPFAYYYKGRGNCVSPRKRFKTALAVNVVSFFSVLIFATVFMFRGNVFAADEAAAVNLGGGLKFIAAALSTGLGCIGTGIGVGAAASSAIGAISENEGIFGKTLVFVGLAEGVAIYGFLISLMILFS
ncbi:MAG: ATP synthase subunit C [Clostridiales bacterium]|jgi:V/A-type H+-transporting ATPase subunit K|nr:ATP synthase subunit C [Clostridiales bacterium]